MRRTRRRDRLSLESVGPLARAGRRPCDCIACRRSERVSSGPFSRTSNGRGKEGGPVVRKGDLIVVNARRVGGPPREGEIIEVIEGELRVQYRVRWSDGHESLFAPGAGASRIEPARDGEKTSSEGTEPKKLPATASTAKKSTAAKTTAAKTTAAKTTAAKTTAKKAAAKTTTTKKS